MSEPCRIQPPGDHGKYLMAVAEPESRPPSTWRKNATLLLGLVGLMWLLEVVDLLLPGQPLDGWGIRPRSLIGLAGIFFTPFAHGGFGHLLANTPPILILGGLSLLSASRHFWNVTLIIVAVGGLGIWLIGGTQTVHIGASGLVFGYFGYLVLKGYFERRPVSIAMAVVVVAIYGGLIFGVLPGRPGVSWLGHLCGFLAGGFAALTTLERRKP